MPVSPRTQTSADHLRQLLVDFDAPARAAAVAANNSHLPGDIRSLCDHVHDLCARVQAEALRRATFLDNFNIAA